MTPTFDETLPDHCAKSVVVLCCGNPLRGDDGFGPAVAARLNAGDVPEWAVVIDAGTGVRGLLFDILTSERRPDRVIVVDALDLSSDAQTPPDWVREPGEIFEIPIDRLEVPSSVEASVHLAPTSGLLRALHDADVRIEILACQIASIPGGVSEGLSPPVAAAVERASGSIEGRFLREPPLT